MPQFLRPTLDRLPRCAGACRWAAAAAALALAIPCHATDALVLHGRAQGTTYNIRYWTDAADAPAPPAMQRSVDAVLADIDEQMSTWRADSELSRFNAAEPGAWFPVSRDLAAVVARAIELHEITGGASDVTVGPVLRVWGFGAGAENASPRTIAPPSDDALAAARRKVGAEHLHVRMQPPELRKDLAGLEVDVSSLAAGYTIDRLVDALAVAGVKNALVELGGEVRGVGVRRDGKPWRVGVEAPPQQRRAVALVVPLANLALATSGDFHHVRTIDDVVYTHILDPRTGRPVRYRGASVTVVAPTCFEADGVATALFVLGPEAGYAWCVKHGVAALFLEPAASADGSVETTPARRTTPRFEELLGHE
jgi:thiamine biosynthesis lipoprotein